MRSFARLRLDDGGYNASRISLTELGKRLVAPTEEGDDLSARADAIMKPKILQEFFTKYDRAKFPRDEIAKNVLVEMGLPKDRAEKALEILRENGRFAGLIQDTKTGLFIALLDPAVGRTRRAPLEAPEIEIDSEDVSDQPPIDTTVEGVSKSIDLSRRQESGPKKLFVAHGKNHKPLEDLKKILNQFKIPFKVAIDEPNKGRPISGKVAALMTECSAGIFIFTKDECFYKKEKEEMLEVWRPSENVVYELGGQLYPLHTTAI